MNNHVESETQPSVWLELVYPIQWLVHRTQLYATSLVILHALMTKELFVIINRCHTNSNWNAFYVHPGKTFVTHNPWTFLIICFLVLYQPHFTRIFINNFPNVCFSLCMILVFPLNFLSLLSASFFFVSLFSAFSLNFFCLSATSLAFLSFTSSKIVPCFLHRTKKTDVSRLHKISCIL